MVFCDYVTMMMIMMYDIPHILLLQSLYMLLAAAVGHFVVVCGYNAVDRIVYYKNPASRKGLMLDRFDSRCFTFHPTLERGFTWGAALRDVFPQICQILFIIFSNHCNHYLVIVGAATDMADRGKAAPLLQQISPTTYFALPHFCLC